MERKCLRFHEIFLWGKCDWEVDGNCPGLLRPIRCSPRTFHGNHVSQKFSLSVESRLMQQYIQEAVSKNRHHPQQRQQPCNVKWARVRCAERNRRFYFIFSRRIPLYEMLRDIILDHRRRWLCTYSVIWHCALCSALTSVCRLKTSRTFTFIAGIRTDWKYSRTR